MAKKFYVVWKGRQTGVFGDWGTCKAQVYEFAGARYKSYPTKAEADAAFQAGSGGGGAAKGAPKKRSSAAGVKTYNGAEVDALEFTTKIFTDGGCEPNPGNAGTGLAVYRDGEIAELWYGLNNPNGTNNTAELNGLIQALMIAEQELAKEATVAIFCDSKYSIQCVTQWAISWEKKGWTKASGEIKNLDLIQPAYALHQRLKKQLSVFHVNGHVGVEGNELADRMSVLAMQSREAQFVRYKTVIDIPTILATRPG